MMAAAPPKQYPYTSTGEHSHNNSGEHSNFCKYQERMRLLSEEIGDYNVRDSGCSSTDLKNVTPTSPMILMQFCALNFLAAFGESG
jgi:hypothetical protein